MKIGIQSGHTVMQLGAKRAYAMYRKAGFEAIDWNIDSAVSVVDLKSGDYLGKSVLERPLDEILAYYSEELQEIEANGLTISQAHAPFPAYVDGSPDVLDYMIVIYRNTIELCARLGIKNLVIHGISLSKENSVDSPDDIAAMNWLLYSSLIPALQNNNVTVCLENLFSAYSNARREKVTYEGHCSDPHAAAELIDRLNAEAGKECFGLCVDTGHLHLMKKDMRVYLPIVGGRIKALHIHDNDAARDMHVAPYTGSIVWKDFYETLNKLGYRGDLCFETFRQTSTASVDEEMVQPWLNLIFACGDFFRRKILGR